LSRLDSFIRRMQAQRLLINQAVAAISSLEGPVLEFGLGNGRTYHHLRERLPQRRIIAFDIKVTAHQDSVPPAEDLVLGDIRETAPHFIGCEAVLIHLDIGTGVEECDQRTQAWLAPLVPKLLAPRGLAISGLALEVSDLEPLPLPDAIGDGRYFYYRRA
jgi:hypothetical protein